VAFSLKQLGDRPRKNLLRRSHVERPKVLGQGKDDGRHLNLAREAAYRLLNLSANLLKHVYHQFVSKLLARVRDRPIADARVAVYPFKRLFEVAETTTDVQSGLAETCFLPSPDVREKETWYINMGVTNKNMFELQAVVDAAH
jgi:hypothetical protein